MTLLNNKTPLFAVEMSAPIWLSTKHTKHDGMANSPLPSAINDGDG